MAPHLAPAWVDSGRGVGALRRRAAFGAPARAPNRLVPDRPERRTTLPRRARRVALRHGLRWQIVEMRAVPDAGGSLHACHEGRITNTTPGLSRSIQAANGLEVGAAWKKVSQAEQPYVSCNLDDPPSFPATIYACLIEGEDGTPDLIWSRSKGD